MYEKKRESEKEGGEREIERYVVYGYFIFIFKRKDRCLGTF